MELNVIARIRGELPTKFGIPRQSGLAASLRSEIVFTPDYRNDDALRGLEGFSHLWLIWEFSEAVRKDWSPTVRPPRLGGNTRLGVFATRSPFRPNPLGLSCVKLEEIRHGTKDGTVLIVSGADLMDGTPIYDIKPYLPYADCRPEASGGFAADAPQARLTVNCPDRLLSLLPAEQQAALTEILSLDPRPSYQNDPDRVYGMRFAGFELHFTVCGDILTVTDMQNEQTS